MQGKGSGARLALRLKFTDRDDDLWELVAWWVPVSAANPLGVKYRFAFVPFGERRPAVLYDNHAPKGPHKHVEGREEPMYFDGLVALRAEFELDVQTWKKTTGKRK